MELEIFALQGRVLDLTSIGNRLILGTKRKQDLSVALPDPVRQPQARSNLGSFLTFMLDRGATLDG
jgi:hypothetical protein